ncbi:MAG: hypothetical protein IPG79_08495 [Saprospiraceae bacterium]|nr:hypothetical protein [Saprospiraceae bacterium]
MKLDDKTESVSIYNILPKNEAIYNNYTGNLNNVVLSSGEKFELLKYNTSYAEGYGLMTSQSMKLERRFHYIKLKLIIAMFITMKCLGMKEVLLGLGDNIS